MSITNAPLETPTKRSRADLLVPSVAQAAAADRGRRIAREAVANLNQLINRSRSVCGGDPAALAAWATILLHKVVDNGLPGDRQGGDSVVHALRETRGRAVAETRLGPSAVSELIGIGVKRSSEILVAGRRGGQ